MKDFKGARKPGGFGAKSSFGDRGGSRGSFGRPQRSSFGNDRGGRDFERPTMHQAVCSECGDNCEVPFRPNGTKPVLCSVCFGAQKGGDRPSFPRREREFSAPAERTMFKATCQECGSSCEVPFRPTEGKPIFCSDCFRGNDSANKPMKSKDNYQEQLTAVHAKLDHILNVLKANSAFVSQVEKIEKFGKEEIAPVVKVAKKAAKEVVKEVKTEIKAVVKKAKKVEKEVKAKIVKPVVVKAKKAKKKA